MSEMLLVITKTLIRSAHPYRVPEIIALPVACGLSDYLHWVNSETRLTKE